MGTKRILALALPLLLALPAHAELIKWSLLQKPARGFSLTRDIFQGGMETAGDRSPAVSTASAAQAENLQKSIAEEIAQSITYEGFIVKNGKRSALLNVSGEFFSVGEQDVILDKIRILKISKDAVTIEYDRQPYDIRIKGDENG